jgi:two-component system CheB/CheR fusion protein
MARRKKDRAKPREEEEEQASAAEQQAAAWDAEEQGPVSEAHEPVSHEPEADAPEEAIFDSHVPPVAGIVASAGGLEAYKRLLMAMPVKSGVAFVLIPHLDPTHESLMVELLARYTQMRVVEAEEGMQVEANRVYVIPPNKYMTIASGVLRLTGPVERRSSQTSIDVFLRSLAWDLQEKAICIVLSGTGSHGTLGLKAVKANGGMAMVQDPRTADYDRMPRSAVATGLADYVLPVEHMPEALVGYVQHFYVNGDRSKEEHIEAPDQINAVLAVLRAHSKYDFRCYRKRMLVRRVERRMGLNHLDKPDAYLAFLREHPDEIKHLSRDLLISVTSFFRDPEAYKVLQSEVVVPLVESKQSDDPIRVWVPGCATGEEPYSIAMLLLDEMAKQQKACRLQIFATDVDEEVLDVARVGIYPESITTDVSPERLRHFTRVDETVFQVCKQLRESVTFATQNLISDPPFSKMDLVSCRNLLIYLEPETQRKIIPLIHFALKDGGYLFLGPSETIVRQTELFEPISKKWRIYRRIGPSRLDRIEFPVSGRSEPQRQRRMVEPEFARIGRIVEIAQRTLLEEFVPATVLINRKCQVLYLFGPTADYLEVPSGEPTNNLLEMVREGLRTKLRKAVQSAIEDGHAVIIDDVHVRRGGAYYPVEVTVKLLQSPRNAAGLMLVTFRAKSEPTPPPPPLSPEDEDSRIRQLDHELRATREDLNSTIEELESSNEELRGSNEEVMSMNEELQSTNEELETSKEELQSLNEELTTVNNQLHEKLEELEGATNDLANLLNCTDIATVFLDTELRIKRFTPASTRMFNLIATDVGRPLSDIAQKYLDPHLLRDAQEVLRDLTTREHEVTSEGGHWCIRRILPYRTSDNRVEGVLMTFTDVTQLKGASEKARLLATVLLDSNDAVIVHDFEGRIQVWNSGAERLYGYTETEALQMNAEALVPPEQGHGFLAAWDRLRRKVRVLPYEGQRVTKDGRRLDVAVTSTVLLDDRGRTAAIATTEHDITDRKQAQARLEAEVARQTAILREQQQRLRAILNSPDDAIITCDQGGIIESVNSATERMFGFTTSELIGQNVKTLLMPAFEAAHDVHLQNFLNSGEQKPGGLAREVTARRKDGSFFPVELAVSEVENYRLYTGILRDASKRKALERQVLEIAELERRRIGTELHDQVGQELTALGLLSGGLLEAAKAHAEPDSETLRKISQGIQRVLRQVRGISRGLVPIEVNAQGLTDSLKELVEQLDQTSPARCSFYCDPPAAVDNDIQAQHLYLITGEACTNALRHGTPEHIEVSLLARDGRLVLRIADDGTGVPDQFHDGLGIRLMRNRARLVNASLTILPAEPKGTQVVCTLIKDSSDESDQR